MTGRWVEGGRKGIFDDESSILLVADLQCSQIRVITLQPTTHLVVEVDGAIVSAEPDRSSPVSPVHVANGHQYLCLTVATDANIIGVMVVSSHVLDEVDGHDVRVSVRVHYQDVIVAAVAGVGAQTLVKATVLTLAEEAVHTHEHAVGGVQIELEHISVN